MVVLLGVCISMALEAGPELIQNTADSEILTADLIDIGYIIPDVFYDPNISEEMFNALNQLTGPND